MLLNTFKIFLISFLLCSFSYSESITFKLPDGWGKNETMSEKGSLLVFTPVNQNSESPSEFLSIKTEKYSVGAERILWNNLIEIKRNYPDFKYYKPKYDYQDSMGLGCSIKGSFCLVQRVEKQGETLFVYTYTNNYPHYSQGLFGKWTNICSQIKAGEQEKLEEHQEVFEI